jgi:hypothetical protein
MEKRGRQKIHEVWIIVHGKELGSHWIILKG